MLFIKDLTEGVSQRRTYRSRLVLYLRMCQISFGVNILKCDGWNIYCTCIGVETLKKAFYANWGRNCFVGLDPLFASDVYHCITKREFLYENKLVNDRNGCFNLKNNVYT